MAKERMAPERKNCKPELSGNRGPVPISGRVQQRLALEWNPLPGTRREDELEDPSSAESVWSPEELETAGERIPYWSSVVPLTKRLLRASIMLSLAHALPCGSAISQ